MSTGSKKLGAAAIFFALWCLTAQAAELKIDNISLPLPMQTQSSWILRDVIQNGVNTNMLGLTFYVPLESVYAHFRAELMQWGQYREEQKGEWAVLSQKRDDLFISLQLQEQAFGAIGMLTVSEDYYDQLDLSPRTLRLPGEFTLINLLQDDQSETITLSTNLPVAAATRSIETALNAKGWRKRNEIPQPQIDAVQSYYTRARQSVGVFIANDDSWDNITLVYLNQQR